MSLKDIIPEVVLKAKDPSTAMKLMECIDSDDNKTIIEFKRNQYLYYIDDLIGGFKEQIDKYVADSVGEISEEEFKENTDVIGNNLVLFIFFPPYLQSDYAKSDANQKPINVPPDYKKILNLANYIPQKRLIRKMPLLFVKFVLTAFILYANHSNFEHDTNEFSQCFGILLKYGLKDIAINYIREIINSPSPLILGNIQKFKVELEKLRNELTIPTAFEHSYTRFIEDPVYTKPPPLPKLTANSAFPYTQQENHSGYKIDAGRAISVQDDTFNFTDIVFDSDDTEWESKEEYNEDDNSNY